jgi:uncharacterized damage-inducible protein DinB
VTLSSPAELLTGYLDHYRETVLRKLDGLSEHELRHSRLPSGWVPLALLKHLAHVERRWVQWGFTAEQVEEPWGDHQPERGQWKLDPDETLADVTAFFQEQCARTREIVAGASLADQSAVGGRFAPGEERPTLIWILFHLLQEYARHAGQLDVVRELANGSVGE